jgi:hypothetical protein
LHQQGSQIGIEKLAQESYPQVAPLKQVKCVGTLIALTFLLTLEDLRRFGKSRDVAATWDYNRDEETQGRVSRRCTSARKAIPGYNRRACILRNQLSGIVDWYVREG